MPVNCRFRMLILIFLALGVPQIYAQSWEVNLNFITGFPQNEFGDNVDNVGLGGGGGFGYHLGSNPILVGGEFSFLIYGSETQRVPVIITIPNVTVDVQTSNNILFVFFDVSIALSPKCYAKFPICPAEILVLLQVHAPQVVWKRRQSRFAEMTRQ